MLTFAVVVSRRGGRVPARVLDRLRESGCADVPFDAQSHLVWSNEGGTVWFGGWQDASDEGPAAHHWHVDDDGLTAFAGQLWPRREGWRGTRPWAEQLAERLRVTPLIEESDDLAGVYVAASLHRRGRCSVAADPLGIGLIYWGQGQDVSVISSRAALAAGLLVADRGGEPKRDALGAGWLAFGIHAMGRQTGFEQVSVVSQGARLEIDPGEAVRVLPPAHRPWHFDPKSTPSPKEALAEARLEIAVAIRMAHSLPAPTCAGLTGGKDSRLVLALVLADGLADDVEFQTAGRRDLPDVVVASQIAESFGLRHVVNPGRSKPWGPWREAVDAAVRDEHPDASSREIGFRITAWKGSGAGNVAELDLGRPPFIDQVLLSGGCGEALRTNYPATARFRSKEAMARDFPAGLNLGTAGILRPDSLAYYRRELHHLFFDDSIETDTAQDVVDAFYIQNRLRRWLGTGVETDSQSRSFPLYSITAVRLAFAIGAESRRAEWIHYQLIRQNCEPLLHVPFAGSEWHPGADGKPSRPRPIREAPPLAPTSTPTRIMDRLPCPSAPLVRTVGRDQRARLAEDDREVMRRFLREDLSNPVFDIIDPGAARDAVDGFEHLPERHKLQLYGALSAAIWLGRYEVALPRGITIEPSAS